MVKGKSFGEHIFQVSHGQTYLLINTIPTIVEGGKEVKIENKEMIIEEDEESDIPDLDGDNEENNEDEDGNVVPVTAPTPPPTVTRKS
jgi:hypothetical protein